MFSIMPKPGSFDRSGEHALQMNQWFLAQARGAIAEGLSPLQADYSWTTFQIECPDLVERIAKQHPPPEKKKNDTLLRARENHGYQFERFEKWLKTAEGKFTCLSLPWFNKFVSNYFYFVLGYTKTFAKRIGLIESGLGGTCGDNPVKPGNDKEESDEDSDSPLAGDDEESTPAPAPKKKDPAPKAGKTLDEKLQDLTEETLKWTIADKLEGSEMQLKTAFLPKVKVRGQPFKKANVLVVQGRVAGGCLLRDLDISVDDDGKGGVVECPLDPNCSSGMARVMQEWRNGNPGLAATLEVSLEESCQEDVLPGAGYEIDTGVFKWPGGVQSLPTMLDPYDLYFRAAPLPPGGSLVEIDSLDLRHGDDASTAPCVCFTAFFYDIKPCAKPGVGGLRMPPPKKPLKVSPKRRKHEDDDFAMVDDDDSIGDGGGKPKARASSNIFKTAAAASLGAFVTVATLGRH